MNLLPHPSWIRRRRLRPRIVEIFCGAGVGLRLRTLYLHDVSVGSGFGVALRRMNVVVASRQVSFVYGECGVGVRVGQLTGRPSVCLVLAMMGIFGLVLGTECGPPDILLMRRKPQSD